MQKKKRSKKRKKIGMGYRPYSFFKVLIGISIQAVITLKQLHLPSAKW